VSIELVNRRGVLRAVVVDPERWWRNALAAMLSRLGAGTVSVCESSTELRELIRSSRPHLALLEAGEASRALAEVHRARHLVPHLTIVFAGRTAWVAFPAELDVAAILNKSSELEEIESVLHDLIRERLEWATLTPRELEILSLVAEGTSNRAIARRLSLPDDTLRFHSLSAYRKLGVSNRGDAVRRARELGLLSHRAAIRGDDPPPGFEPNHRGLLAIFQRLRRDDVA